MERCTAESIEMVQAICGDPLRRGSFRSHQCNEYPPQDVPARDALLEALESVQSTDISYENMHNLELADTLERQLTIQCLRANHENQR
ncbi:MAG: hypothetical protein CMM94_03720 [Rickettsiales bacterium]|nr:hypothetical protein [Rickettsiales bacterium]|tara:strand:+ start:578 stop:841 length:264 start_codon:yes stop_codon:yes gene_type:complete